MAYTVLISENAKAELAVIMRHYLWCSCSMIIL